MWSGCSSFTSDTRKGSSNGGSCIAGDVSAQAEANDVNAAIGNTLSYEKVNELAS